VKLEYSLIRDELTRAMNEARRVYEADKDTPSGAYDSGRYDGLKQAVQIVDKLWDEA
jgi:hypothetical protein